MNACASCRATILEAAAFCPQCGTPVPSPGKAPSAWRRVITGAIALPFLGGGALLLVFAAGAEDELAAFFGFLYGGIAVVIGVPFIIAAVVPFGRPRRVAVGVGAALLGLVVLGGSLFPLGPAGLLIALVGAIGLFYLGYRVAR